MKHTEIISYTIIEFMLQKTLTKDYNLITVAGNIGAGKTFLATKLAQQYDANLILEQFVDNPFLPKFYDNPVQYAFHTEVFFLLDRHQQLLNFFRSRALQNRLNITDYLFNKTLLFAAMNLEIQEYQLFERLFNTLYPEWPQPELVVYINSSVGRLLKNIRHRGRGFEQAIPAAYLKRVECIYFEYFKKNPHLKVVQINADHLDFVNNPAHYQQILECINQDYQAGITEVTI